MIDLRYESNYLMHYGIKGQKWGVRRFQNEDGSLTSEGKKRYYSGDGFERAKSAIKRVASKTGKAAGKLLTKAKNRISEKIDDKLDERDPSRMSDQELREKINRLNMERQYKQLVRDLDQKPRKEHKLGKFVGHTLSTVLVATATTTLASIAKRSMEIKSDQILAPRRMAKALKDGAKDIYGREKLEDFTYFPRGGKGGKNKNKQQ